MEIVLFFFDDLASLFFEVVDFVLSDDSDATEAAEWTMLIVVVRVDANAACEVESMAGTSFAASSSGRADTGTSVVTLVASVGAG